MGNQYKVVTKEELINILGKQCSPDKKCRWYGVGPDIHGGLSHCASFISQHDAMAWLRRHQQEIKK